MVLFSVERQAHQWCNTKKTTFHLPAFYFLGLLRRREGRDGLGLTKKGRAFPITLGLVQATIFFS